MKTKLSITFMLITSFLLAQSNQLIYGYRFKMDSLNRDNYETENMVLQTSPSGSRFFSQVKYIYDSTMTATFKKARMTQNNHFDFTNMKSPKVNFEVTKTYPDYKRLLKKSIASTRLAISNEKKSTGKSATKKTRFWAIMFKKQPLIGEADTGSRGLHRKSHCRTDLMNFQDFRD